MIGAFDPEAVRRRLESSIGLDFHVKLAIEQAASPMNFFAWRSILHEIVEARLVGFGSDARVEQMLRAIVDALEPRDWEAERRVALAAKSPGPGVSDERARVDRLGLVGVGCATLAFAAWLRSGEKRTDLFSLAYDHARVAFVHHYGKASKWPFGAVGSLVELGCLGERFTEVSALFEAPQLAKYRELDLPKARTSVELGHALALHRLHGRFTDEEIAAACERTLRREVVHCLEHSGAGPLAALAYLVAMARSDVDGRELLDGMTDYVSYLAKGMAAAPLVDATRS